MSIWERIVTDIIGIIGLALLIGVFLLMMQIAENGGL